MKPRPRKYRTADGDYLTIDDSDGAYRVAWYIADWCDIGGRVGESEQPDAAPEDRSDWEMWQADRCVKRFASGRDIDGYYFDSMSKARAALAAANEGLLSGEAPWPEWALLAKAAGWTPPEGWRP